VAVTSFPEARITTDRLDIREFDVGDADLVREALSVGEPEGLPPGAPSEPDELSAWLAEGVHQLRHTGWGVHLMLLDRARAKMVGAIGVFNADWEVRSAEIGYGVRSDERGRGYATEALVGLSRWMLTEGGIQRAWLTANVDNVASVRVAEKAGFRREGTLRRAAMEEDGLHDQAIFSLLDDEIREDQPLPS
jgi:RimJ/RimL family protein N-acetyltransferase